MDSSNELMDAILGAIKKSKDELEKKKYVLNDEGYSKFVNTTQLFYTLFSGCGLKSFEIKPDTVYGSAYVYFYFNEVIIPKNKYDVFLKYITLPDGLFFTEYKNMVEVTLTINNVWNEVLL